MSLRTTIIGEAVRRWRYGLIALLFAGFLIGPISHASALGSQDVPVSHHHDATGGGNAGPEQPDSRAHDHGTTHCSMFSCAPTFTGIHMSSSSQVRLSSSACLFSFDDPMLRSLYLDSDPPVPRLPISLI